MLAGQVAGTLNYMAPEQIEARPVDGRADLYGLACTAFEMLAGEPPFRRAEDLGLMWAQLAEPPPPLTSFRPDLPPAVDQAMARAMAWSPDDRYQTCLDFAASLLAESGLERAASAPSLTGPARVATRQAGPWAAGPADVGDRAGGMHAADHAVGQQWSPAPLTTPDVERRPAWPLSDYSRPAITETALPPLPAPGPGLGPGESGPDGPGESWPDGPEAYWPARGRSPGRTLVIAAAAVVVIVALAGAAFLVLRGSGPAPARHAAPASPSAGIRPDSTRQGGHGSVAGPSSTAGPSSIAGPSGPASPGAAANPGTPSTPATPNNPSAPSSPSSPGEPGRPAGSAGPAATVSAYVAAINHRDYARAWRLGGRNSSPSYKDFVQGFGTTAKDTLTILSVSGHVVTAWLTAEQTDGSVQTYEGTYTVHNGAITTSAIDRIS
jgi:hypothetical protein